MLFYRYYSQDSKAKSIDELGYQIRKVGAHTFNNYPVAILIYNDKFIIEWINFMQENFRYKLVGKHLSDLIQLYMKNKFGKLCN